MAHPSRCPPGRTRRQAGTMKRRRHVAASDGRSPMLRLLQDCVAQDGTVQPDYEQQFRTLFRAQRIGYVGDDRRLTDLGKSFLEKCKGTAP